MKRSDPALAEYVAKRDFAATPEPAPEAATSSGALPRFVVQKHAARRLHYDFRLEIGGVLKSWALTRAPVMRAGEKSLAVRTEDHPLAYAEFEGTIPPGHYGGGTVMLWDEGSFEVGGGDPARALAEGKLHLFLKGSRLVGEWALVRTGGQKAGAKERWLFLKVAEKGRAQAAVADAESAFLTSVRTGRTMHAIAAGQPPAETPRRAAGKPPPFTAFQLCERSRHPPATAGWLHEIKHDGYRAQVALGGGKVVIRLRSGGDATARLPRLAAALAPLAGQPALLDGELIVQDEKGRSRFGLLQAALAAKDDSAIIFVAFDLLVLGRRQLSALPLGERKARLKAFLDTGPTPPSLLYSDHVAGDGTALWREACALELEGIISKRADSPYRGHRTTDWLKVKCSRSRAFTVIGWLPSTARHGLKSLLVAERRGRALAYAGKVGTGFSDAELEEIPERLAPLATDAPAVPVPAAVSRGARWVEPRLQVDVGFTELTGEGVLRHPVWLGFSTEAAAPPPAPRPAPAQKAPAISNRQRIVFPEAGASKGDLADFIAAMAPHILEHAARRPLSLVRCPDGVAGQCFFQKHAREGFEGVRQTRPDSEGRRWIHVDDAAGLIACVQMGTVEFHGWGSRVGALDTPDRLVIDLDPDEGLPFETTRAAAMQIKGLLADMGLVSFPMLSGGKGVHVVVPLDTSARWPRVKDFARRFALALEAAEPDRYVATAAKAGRTGRIFIDWMRNQRGATAVMPYTVRAKPTAPVAVPLDWAALAEAPSADMWRIGDLPALLEHALALRGWGEASQPLPDL